MIKVIKSDRGGTRIYNSNEEREDAIKEFKANGRNYFVKFKDVNGYGLQYSTVDWMPEGQVYCID